MVELINRFLVTSPDKAILHTGDVRSDRVFMQALRRNPVVSEFIGPLSPTPESTTSTHTRSGRRTLDRIYLDTSAM